MLLIVSYISLFSIAIPLFTGGWLFKRLLITSRILVYFVLATAIIECIATVLFQYGVNNLFTFHAHTIVEFVLLGIVFRRLIDHDYFKMANTLVLVSFVMLSVYLVFAVQGLSHFNSVQRHVEGAILIGYAFIYLFQRDADERWIVDPFAIFSMTVLLYFGGSLFVFMFGDYMFSTGQDSAWIIHGILNSIFNIILALVFSLTISKPSK